MPKLSETAAATREPLANASDSTFIHNVAVRLDAGQALYFTGRPLSE